MQKQSYFDTGSSKDLDLKNRSVSNGIDPGKVNISICSLEEEPETGKRIIFLIQYN
jgi:hypothetical protein